MQELSKQILSTIIYYDILDYPLTAFEIWKYRLSCNIEHGTYNKEEKITLKDILEDLEKENLKKYIEEFRGFYFLRGRKELVSQRIERNKISIEKIKKIRRIVWLLRFVPFVRMVAVTGRVAMKNARHKSDLDVLIVLKKSRIFIGRTLVTFFTHLIGKRRHKDKIKDRICLNYFITTNSLEVDLQDLFSSSEYSFIFPIFNFKVFKKFQKNNKWIANWRVNFYQDGLANRKMVVDTYISKIIRKAGEKILDWERLERLLEQWETKKIEKNPLTWRQGSIIRANGRMLVFLPEAQGPKIYERFLKRMKALD